jgi:hypothetical protein
LSKEALLERTYQERLQPLRLLFLDNIFFSVPIYTIIKQTDIIVFQPMEIYRTSARALFGHITTMNDKRCSVDACTNMVKHMEKMVKQFAITVANIFNKAKKKFVGGKWSGQEFNNSPEACEFSYD